MYQRVIFSVCIIICLNYRHSLAYREISSTEKSDVANLNYTEGIKKSFYKQDTSFNIFHKIKEKIDTVSFHGFSCAEFLFKGRKARIVKPKFTAKGKPWIWRARFWNHEPQTEIALLKLGFHVVYCDVSELFGNPGAIHIWNEFYNYLRKKGLAKKAVLEGMSRGGVYVYNWAVENPRKVACIYADNPVLDLKSWPGGKGVGPGSKKEWDTFLKDYDLQTPKEIEEFKGSPLNKTQQIVKGKYPMLHVCGDADEIVPIQENTLPFIKLIREAGGEIELILKPGGKHHPHSLKDPKPIVDFILKASKAN